MRDCPYKKENNDLRPRVRGRITTEHRGTNYEGEEIEDTEDGCELKGELHENPVT